MLFSSWEGNTKPGTVKPGTVKAGTVKAGTATPGIVRPGTVKPTIVKLGIVRPRILGVLWIRGGFLKADQSLHYCQFFQAGLAFTAPPGRLPGSAWLPPPQGKIESLIPFRVNG